MLFVLYFSQNKTKQKSKKQNATQSIQYQQKKRSNMSDDYPNANVFSSTIFSDNSTILSIQDDDDEYIIDEIVMEDLPVDEDNDDDEDDDDIEQKVHHDQLRSVKEVKTSQSYIPTAQLLAKNCNRRIKLYLIISGVFAAAIIAIVVVIVVATTRMSSNKSGSSRTTTTTNANRFDRFDKVVNFLYENRISSLPALKIQGSVEHYAALFMAELDAYQLEPTPANKRRFVERYVLVLLYYQTNGNAWKNHYKFLSGRDHCEWTETITNPAGTFIKGIECNDEGYVIGIDLSNNNLISVQHPRSIPAEIIHLLSLEKLHLHHNDLGGQIPNIQSMNKIKSIGLMDTGLRGVIPDWFGDMVQLTTLALSRNDFYSTIPDSFKNLVNLRILGLDGMGLEGSIDSLKGMNKLEALYLEDNHLTGVLQGNVWSHIKELDVSNNMLDGTIPYNLFHMPNLKVLDLNRNLFYGDFPNDIIVNDSLEYIAMSQNSLEGPFSDR
jgi:Leucine-rich repeat (LRR) protein